MVFEGKKYFFVMSPETGHKWVAHPIKIKDLAVDVDSIDYSWPKITQINPDEFLLVGGNKIDYDIYAQIGVPFCYKLNIKTSRLSKIADLPSAKMAS